jgi:hypothetical protein
MIISSRYLGSIKYTSHIQSRAKATMNRSFDSSTVFSPIIGILSWTVRFPILFTVFGLALGINAILKERKLAKRQPLRMYAGIAGCVLNGLALLIFFVARQST